MFKTWTTCAVSMKYASSRLMSSTGCQHVKHGPRTILLKLLTILLSGSPFRWWTRQQGPAGPTRRQSQLRRLTLHVQHRCRAINVKIVELAGINQFQMFATVSIKKGGLKGERVRSQPIRPQIKFPRGISDQVISCGIGRRPSTGRAPGPGLKLQAASHKLQASSTKRQAFEPTCSSAKRQASQPE